MSRARTPIFLVVVALALALVAAGSAGAARSVAKATGTPSNGSAQVALQRALAVFAPAEVDARFRSAVAGVQPSDATIVLRDLVAAKARLSGADRQLANDLLARPTDGPGFEGPAGWNGTAQGSKKRFCNTRFCIHWVTKTNEAPSLVDSSPNNNRPDYVDRTIANMTATWNKEIVAYDYKKPLPDRASGGHSGGNPNGKIDIFISNIGDQGIYGYCTTDDPRTSQSSHRQTSGYCVIDDDFSPSEFTSGANRDAANKVTLAHEFFHAVQFAYDFFDNRTMMEGTATWMEDEVFTSVNDSRQYLVDSPLGSEPWLSLDETYDGRLWQYGTWIFYRHLSENLGAGAGDSPVIIRRIWEKAVGGARQGFKAVAPALSDRGTSLIAQMRTFGQWNSAPGASGHYREGNSYPTATPNTTPGAGGSLGGIRHRGRQDRDVEALQRLREV